MSKKIRVTVAPDGTISAETLGMEGLECLDHVAVLEDLLEATAVSSRFTVDEVRVDETVRSQVSDELN